MPRNQSVISSSRVESANTAVDYIYTSKYINV